MKIHDKKYDYIIVGSGTGGATLARELSRGNENILVIEKGRHEEKYGSFADSLRYFDLHKITHMPIKSKEGVRIYRTIMAGGSGFVSAGNFVRSMEKEFKEMGLDLTEEFLETERELKIAPIYEGLISKGGWAIAEAANELGCNMKLMPKAINPAKCIKCGNCTLGCITGAKWTPLVYLKEAEERGVEIMYNTSVKKVVEENGSVKGVLIHRGKDETLIKAGKVILSAGGIGTPIILQLSGIKNAGNSLFVDTFVMVYVIHEELSLVHEPQMSLVCTRFHKSDGFILSPHVNHLRPLKYIEAGMRGFMMDDKKTLGIMTKIRDENLGRVYPNGSILKTVTRKDRGKILKGTDLSTEILLKTGVKLRSIIKTNPTGAHPGGTAAMDEIVDYNFETKIGNLFVCDASVFPKSPGLPPMVTIIALAKRLAKIIG
jgi:choline dehydrogenase-like flavoprotein